MKRILIIANTYYQMIVALQLKNTLFIDDKVVLVLTNHSPNMQKVSGIITEKGIFEQCCFAETLGIVSSRSEIDKICDYFQISFMKKNRYSFYLKDICELDFDELICYNFAMDIYGLYAQLYEYNNDIKVSLYEEGILSYHVSIEETNRRKLVNFSRQLVGKGNISNALNNFYCFQKELYKGELTGVSIPEVALMSATANELKSIFNITNIGECYNTKYIFFTSVYDFEGGIPIGEYELVCKVAELVGKENLLIKTHPRDVRNIYEDNGFRVDKNSVIPWEAIQLLGDFSEKIFLTATSGSVLAGSFMSEKPIKTFYMYRCCDISGNSSAIRTSIEIKKLLSDSSMKNILSKVFIVNNVEEILE